MNYIMSDIHGASEAYFAIKDRIALKNNDTLYILGDIFDGNDLNPAACLEILKDIMRHDNIHLLLGDHEYAHIMYYLSEGQEKEQHAWEDYLLAEAFGGASLHAHLTNHLTRKEYDRYMCFLIEQNMSEFLSIGGRPFYLVHGSPVICNKSPNEWQCDVVTTPMDIARNYTMPIISDPDMPTFLKANPKLDPAKAIIIAGHIPTRYVFDTHPELIAKCYRECDISKQQKVIFVHNRMFIDCGCSGNHFGKVEDGWISDLSCIGIDAAGFFVEHLLKENHQFD